MAMLNNTAMFIAGQGNGLLCHRIRKTAPQTLQIF